jgi:hypothetical protein
MANNDDQLAQTVVRDLFRALDQRVLNGYLRKLTQGPTQFQVKIHPTMNHRGEQTDGFADYLADEDVLLVMVNRPLLRKTNRWVGLLFAQKKTLRANPEELLLIVGELFGILLHSYAAAHPSKKLPLIVQQALAPPVGFAGEAKRTMFILSRMRRAIFFVGSVRDNPRASPEELLLIMHKRFGALVTSPASAGVPPPRALDPGYS